MKLAIIALLAAATQARHHHHHRDVGLIQSRVMGIDEKELQPVRAWSQPWPQGLDDGTDDHLVVRLKKEPKEADPPIVYKTNMRQWQEGTWPVYHTWDKDWKKATYHQAIDDGTDDNEVVNVQHRA